jgi:hypothetical protein
VVIGLRSASAPQPSRSRCLPTAAKTSATRWASGLRVRTSLADRKCGNARDRMRSDTRRCWTVVDERSRCPLRALIAGHSDPRPRGRPSDDCMWVALCDDMPRIDVPDTHRQGASTHGSGASDCFGVYRANSAGRSATNAVRT